MNTGSPRSISEFITKYRLPSISDNSGIVTSGSDLMSYSVNFKVLGARATYFVDRILRGAKPADLPIELPSKFELVINLRTAKVLGLTIPQSLLAGADKVIQ